MKKYAPPCSNTGTRGSSSASQANADIAPQAQPAQESTNQQLLVDGAHLAAIWRGPRDRSRAIQFALKKFNGHEFLDVREYVTSSGFMVPTKKGLTISVQQLGRFAACAGKAYREAARLGLTAVST